MVFEKLDKVRTLEKLGKVADILYWVIPNICILCEISVGIGYYDGIITLDQLLLYSVCIAMLAKITHDDQKDRKKENDKKEMINNE